MKQSGRPAFDFGTASPQDVLAEADRRRLNRAAGRAPTDDGAGAWKQTTRRPAPLATVRPPDRVLVRESDVRPSWGGALPKEPGRDFIVGRRVRLSWSSLLADNAKYSPAMRRGKPVMILTEDYRTAKDRARQAITAQLAGLDPLEGPVSLVGRFFEPNRHHRRDLSNYCKLVHDALTGLAYLDDSQIDDLRWIRAGVDIDAPRLELTIETLTPSEVR